MVGYLLWRVLTGLHKNVIMITGHAKFSLDLCFGLLKKKANKQQTHIHVHVHLMQISTYEDWGAT